MTTLAYLDAGTGSMMLQALVGGLAGLAVMGRLFGARVKRALFFWRRSPPVPNDADDAQPEQVPTTPRT